MSEKKYSYEVDLWGGFEKINQRYEEGKKTISEMKKFLSQRAKIEDSYAQSLSKIGRHNTTEARSIGDAYKAIKEDQEGHRQLRADLASSYLKDISIEVSSFSKEMQKQKQQITTTVNALNKELERGKSALQKAKTNYLSKSEACEAALDTWEASQKDPTATPKMVNKHNLAQQKLKKDMDTCNQIYRDQIQSFQKFQLKYETEMKIHLSEFERLEERRTLFLKDTMEKILNAQQKMIENWNSQQQEAQDKVKEINPTQDIQSFIADNATGKKPEEPVQYKPFEWQFEHPSIPSSMKSTPKKVEKKVKAKKGKSRADEAFQKAIAKPVEEPNEDNSNLTRARAEYDYQAQDSTEISFDVGDIIIVTSMDESGWWQGECNGKSGLFPGNYCVLMGEEEVSSSERTCTVEFDFEAENEDELTISEGEIITIISETEGWFNGCNSRGETGLFPANYVSVNE